MCEVLVWLIGGFCVTVWLIIIVFGIALARAAGKQPPTP